MVQIKTIDELEALYYGHNRNLLRKADAPVTTSTTGTFNAIFGAYAWAQLNLKPMPLVSYQSILGTNLVGGLSQLSPF